MPRETDYSPEESSNPEVSIQVEKVVSLFERRIDDVLEKRKTSSVLFEGDFISSSKRNGIYKIQIGNGLAIEEPALFIRFMRSIWKKGDIILTIHKRRTGFIEGETDGVFYYKGIRPNVKFPLDRTAYFVKTKSGSNLMIDFKKFYLEDGIVPLTEGWVAKSSRWIDLYISPSRERDKILVPA
jgi:hypothetical protein